MITEKQFRGVWIEKEILESKEITWMEKIIWSHIKMLDDESRGGCWARNQYIAHKMDVTEGTIAKSLSSMRKKGFIRDVKKFDGKMRVIKAILPEEKK